MDTSVVDDRFLNLSRESHPDLVHSSGPADRAQAESHYASLNCAASVLRDIPQRLKHLIELESGLRPGVVEELPQSLMDLFMDVASVLKQLEDCVRQRNTHSNPMLKALAFQKALALSKPVEVMLAKLQNYETDLVLQLQKCDAQWAQCHIEDRHGLLEELHSLHRGFSHIHRCRSNCVKTVSMPGADLVHPS
ncbi:MAG: hypothetical protein LR011_07575 [Verrucomicrobia bacterium]|nr:hypothetical protein [Verrucomicrobiota bacterium]